MPKDPETLRPRGWKPSASHAGRRRPRNRFYNTAAWRKTSISYRMSHPLCQCKKCQSGRPLPADHVDHIKPINPDDPYDSKDGRYGDPLNWDNLQSLNINCHARKSAKERHL